MASPFYLGGSSPGAGAVSATPLLRYGTRTGYNPTGGIGAGQFEIQMDQVFRPQLQQRLDAQAMARNQEALNAVRMRPVYSSTLEPQAGVTPATSGMTGSGPVRVNTLTKDPEIESDITGVLGQIRGTDVGQVRRQPRSTRLDDVLGNELARFRQDVNDSTQSLKAFTEEFQRDRPEYRALVDQELATIRRILAPETDPTGVAGGLAANLASNNLTRNRLRQQLLAQLARSGKVAEITSPGGTNTYLQREASRGAADALLQDALLRTEMGRRNILDTAGLQTSVLGRGDDILSQFTREGLLPLQAESALDSAQIARLAQLGALEGGNVIASTAGDDLMRRLALLGSASDLRRGIRFEGLEGRFNTGVPSISPIQVNPVNPGGGYDLAELLALLDDQPGGLPGMPINTTAGLPATGTLGNNTEAVQALANLMAFQNAGVDFDMGPGSDASIYGMPGSTRVDMRGNQFVMSPRTRRWMPVGADGLTDEQRYYQ